MRSTRSEPLLFRNTMRITEGHLDEFKQAIQQAVEFVEAHGPQLMVQVFIDDEALLAYSFQLYPDSAAILTHWSMSDPYIREVMRHCTVERLDIYGEPDQTVTQGLATVAPDDLVWNIVPRHIGFLQTPQVATHDVGAAASGQTGARP